VGSVAITAVPAEDRKRSDPTVGLSLTARPNRSLSPAVRRWVAAGMCVPVLVVATVVTAQGAWLVLPFAGLEVAMIVFAFRWLRAGDGDFETVTILGHELVVRRSMRGQITEARFNLHWVQVVDLRGDLADRRLQVVLRRGLVSRACGLLREGRRWEQQAGDAGQGRRNAGVVRTIHEDSGVRCDLQPWH